jgi:eukaryotic-like serine/threonine-protein kinase
MNENSPTPETVFADAIQITAPEERAAYLDQACRDNPDLRRDMEKLVADYFRAGSFLQPPEADLYATVEASQLSDAPGTVIGPYKLLQQIGEGGMGTVFMAEQTEPVRRMVALKLIKEGMDSRQIIARFEQERQALALMDHPNIAKVFDAGTIGPVASGQWPVVREPNQSQLGTNHSPLATTGRPYFVMELVKGVPITKYCDEHHLTPRQRLELFIPVCQAVQHAHQKGIIHRDLKPSNVLVAQYDGKPVPKVIDFGVAKAAGPKLTDMTLFTELGAVVGTFEYMSPEQAELNQLDVDTRSDIYSLGVLLYELLTGTTPLERKRIKQVALLEVLRLIREEESPKLSTRLSSTEALPSIAANRGSEPKKLRGLMRGELDWIVMKTLEKDRNRRYETANGLAMDVQRYLADEAVQACPPSAAYRIRKFARRNRAAFWTTGVVTLALIIGTVVSAWQAVRATQQSIRAAEAEGLAQERLETANANYEEAEEQRQAAKTQEGLANEQRKIAVANEKTAKEQELLARRRFYAAQMNLAMQAWEAGQPARVLELLEGQRPRPDEEDFRGFEWYYLWGLCRRGHRLALHSPDPVYSLAFSPDGKTLAFTNPNFVLNETLVRLLDSATGNELKVLRGRKYQIWNVSFSPDGKTLAAAGGGVTDDLNLWEVSTGKLIYTVAGRHNGLAFSPDGKTLATWADKGTKLFDTATGQERAVFADGGEAVGFFPDGKTLVTMAGKYDAKAEVQFWDVQSRARRSTIPVPGTSNAVLSRDGTQLATCGGSVELWDTATGKRLTEFPAKAYMRGLAFSPDGKRLAAGGDDRTVVVWDLATGREIGQHVHLDNVWAIAFSPDGKTLASATLGCAVTLWDMTPPEEAITIRNPHAIESLRFTPDSKTLMVGGNPPKFLDVVSGKTMAAVRVARVVAASADGNIVVCRNEDRMTIWDVRAERQIADIPLTRFGANWPGLTLSSDGKMVATFSTSQMDNTVNLWDLATQQPRTLSVGPSIGTVLSVNCAAFSPDAKLLAAGFEFQSIAIWDVATGKVRLEFRQPPTMMNVRSVAFSPDGKALAVGTDTGAVTLWEVETGKRLASFRGHTRTVFCLAFSPDGKTLATAGAETTVRLWDIATGQERVTLKGHTATVVQVTFAPDGNTLATASDDGTLKLWRAATDPEALARKTRPDPHDPDDPLQLNASADRLWKAHRLDQAENVYRRARSTLEKLAVASPNVASYRVELTRCWFSLSLLEFHTGRPKEARQAHDQAKDQFERLSADGQQSVVRKICALGDLLVGADQGQAAEMAYGQAIELALEKPDLWLRRAYAYFKTGEHEKALADFTKVIELDPNNDLAHNNSAWLLATCPDLKFRDPKRAVTLAKKAVGLDPKQGNWWNTLGVAQYRAGDGKAVIAALEKSMELSKGGDANDWFFLAMAHWQLGNKEEARKWYDQAVQWMEKNQPKDEELVRFRAEAEKLLNIK